jgi:hypothetical protein
VHTSFQGCTLPLLFYVLLFLNEEVTLYNKAEKIKMSKEKEINYLFADDLILLTREDHFQGPVNRAESYTKVNNFKLLDTLTV